MIVGVDVDGVVAAFNPGYIALVKEMTGVELPPESDTYPDTWYYPQAAGVTKEQDKELWKHIRFSKDFWFNLKPYPDAVGVLVRLKWLGADIYFVTQRVGDAAKRQTERWLHKSGFPEPTVLVTGSKGAVCKALSITHYIDDKIENCEDVRDTSPNTKGYMLKRPWNKPVDGVPVLNSLDEFMNVLALDKLGGK